MTLDGFDHPPAVVKPRKREYRRLPIIAIVGDEAIDEDGNVMQVGELLGKLPTMQSTLFASTAAADFVGFLHSVYKPQFPTSWQWRHSLYERDICRPDGVKVAARVSIVIHYFGWKGGNYHKIIDPVTMYGHSLGTIWPGQESATRKLLAWATALRDFCDSEGLELRPTSGAISAQFLTDRRFYPNARRKVPAKINASVREHQPGNHYLLNVQPDKQQQFTAYYLDQSRAHHYHARTSHFPDADSLYAYGRFTDLATPVFADTAPGFHGLYCLDLVFRGTFHRRQYHWLPRHDDELKGLFIYSNELDHLRDMGYQVTGVRAAWGSRKQDTGLSRYAQWAERTLDTYGDAPWLKPLLLSTYGVLATRPRYAEAVFCMAAKGTPVSIRTGRYTLDGYHTRAGKKLEPAIANVLHRGMIEAATRSESVGLAQWLDDKGLHILSIYADAVIVRADDDKPLPPLPPPWRLKRTLTHLQFYNQQAFSSGEMTKLPGISREQRQTIRVHAPRLYANVEEIMEHEESVNQLLTH